jgi:DDE superfamily endonuclease
VAYSYAILSATALDVQKEERWLNDAAVQKLQCTNKWVKNFLTRSVIKNFYERNAKFGSANGWELLLWSKTMTIKGITADHKCWYLRHKTNHHIITSQYKAWNDTVRMMMWIELVINPVKERDIDKKLLLWFDNCGCHKTAAIEHIMSELGINVACLPPNMTAILQVLDLVVNGPLKAHIRNNRANKIVQCFKEYKALFDENARKDVGERAVLNFVAPKPDMMECIDNLIQLFGPDGDFQKQKFKDGVISAFMKTGTVPCNVDENGVTNFVECKEESICGTMKIIPLGTQPSNFFDIPVVSMNEESTKFKMLYFHC